MRNKLNCAIRLGLLVSLGLLVTHCNDSTFATSGGTKSSSSTNADGTTPSNVTTANKTGTNGTTGTTPSGTTPTNPSSTNPSACVPAAGGKGNFKFSTAIQTCMDSGKIYDFANNVCTSVGSNTSFACNFDAFNTASAAVLQGGAPPEIEAAKAAGAIMIACGQNTNMVMAQWFTPSAGQDLSSCDFAKFNAAVMNVCYRFYPNGDEPAPATTAAEEQTRVLACLYYPNAGP